MRRVASVEAPSLLRHLLAFEKSLREQPASQQRCQRTLNAISSLRDALRSDFDVAVGQGRPAKLNFRSLQNRAQHLKKKRAEAERELDKARSEKVSGRIQHIWCVRVGLIDPSIPATTLEQFCTNFPEVETKSIGSTYIGSVRNAMVEILKQMSRAAAARAVVCLPTGFGDESRPVFVPHVHDEASMRLRSYDASLPGRPIRGRSSKIQDNCVSVCCAGECVEWPCELQALGQKTGAALGQCIVDIVSEILTCISRGPAVSWSRLRFVHLITGDGINTNQNAGRRVLRFFRENAQWGLVHVRYRQIMIRCSSHVANLVVVVGICGEMLQKAHETNDVCANCSRAFKHLIPDYIEEFSASMRRHLDDAFRIQVVGDLDVPSLQAERQSSTALQALYGLGVLPHVLLSTFNKSLKERVTVVPSACDARPLAKKAFEVLYAHTLFVEDKPVPTRFFLFTSCVAALACSANIMC